MAERVNQSIEEMDRQFQLLQDHGKEVRVGDNHLGVQFNIDGVDDMRWYPSRNDSDPLQNTHITGAVTLFKQGDEYKLVADMESIRPGPRKDTLVYKPDWVLGEEHPHSVRGIYYGGAYGHVYTLDSQRSNWSFHIDKELQDNERTTFYDAADNPEEFYQKVTSLGERGFHVEASDDGKIAYRRVPRTIETP